MTAVAVVVVPAHVVRIEVDEPREVRAVRIERRRPVVAVGAGIGEVRVVAKPRGGEEDRVAVGLACYEITFYAILCSPRPCAVVAQLRPFGIGGHTPFATPVHVSSIVLGI